MAQLPGAGALCILSLADYMLGETMAGLSVDIKCDASALSKFTLFIGIAGDDGYVILEAKIV